MNRDSRAGLTLVEILIAVSLLSLLSAGMMVAMRLGLNTMDKVNARLIANRRVANSRGIIENELNGYIYSMADYRPQPLVVQSIPFFQMEPGAMRFVTSYSLQDGWRGRPQIAVLQVIPGDKGQGVRLIVNETPYTGPAQAGQNIEAIERDPAGLPVVRYTAVLPGPQSFVLADKLAFCRFSYLEQRFVAPFLVWRSDWVNPQQLPRGIRIEMAPLDAAPSDLHVTTVTAPVNVTRSPGEFYDDRF